MIVILFGFLIIGLVIIRFFSNFVRGVSSEERHKLIRLFSLSYIILVTLGTISYNIEIMYNKNQNYNTIMEFINNGKFDKDFYKRTLIGFVSGIVFGMIDNMGLWFGMDELDPILPKGILTKAGLSNAYSDTLGALLAAFIANIIQNITNNTGRSPLWANALGVFTGCVSGVAIARTLTGRK